MKGIKIPIIRDIYAREEGQGRWQRGGLVAHPDGGKVLMWDGTLEKVAPYLRAWAYAEHDGKPLFCGEDKEGPLVRYGQETHVVGEELYGPPDIIEGQVFYLTRFEDGWQMVWNGFGRPLLGNRLCFGTLEITPHPEQTGFDASYESEVDGGVIAVLNNTCSKTFVSIALHTLYQGKLLVCGPMGTKWYAEYDGTGLVIQNWMFDIQFEEEGGILSYRTSLESVQRTEIHIAT